MRIAFPHNAHPREKNLATALLIGMRAHGDQLVPVPYSDEPRDHRCDATAVIGVKSREWVDWCRETGRTFIYFDKGYYYPKEKGTLGKKPTVNCWRVAVNETQPLDFLKSAKCDENRWGKFHVWPKPWREPRDDAPIILAGSSVKYHMFNGLPHPTAFFEEVVRELRQYTDRPIIYRPKPSWREAVPIDGTEFDEYGPKQRPFEELCEGAHAVITHGSNAALIGMLVGVPSIILGNGVMRPISSTDISQVEELYFATEEERRQLLANLAWSQWTLREWQNGSAWHHVKTTYIQ